MRHQMRHHLGLLVLRGALGIVFVAHGAQKFFDFGIPGTQAAFGDMGIPLAAIVAPAVALVELLGGIALLAGLYTRLAAAGTAAVMLGAFFLVHLPAGFFLPGGVEFVFTLLAGSVALAAMGPGALSMDAVLAPHRVEADAPEAPVAQRRAA